MSTITLQLGLVRPLVDRRLVIAYVALIATAVVPLPFEAHLALHVLGAILLIGNALLMAAWLVVAGRSGDPERQRRAAIAVNVGDLWGTIPGVVLLLTHGLAMVGLRYGGEAAIASVPFIGAGLVLLNLTGLVWALRLVPIQLGMLRLARADGPFDRTAFGRHLVGWSIWGIAATVMPIAAAVLMIAKPALW
jgi:uncharacterized membrane protein